MNKTKLKSIDEYISTFPIPTQLILKEINKTIKEVIPDATETISYGMPTFKLKKNLIHFAAYKHHIGIYPTPSGIEEFKKELEEYKTSKGAIQFPLNKPIPLDLIRRIVKYRHNEVLNN